MNSHFKKLNLNVTYFALFLLVSIRLHAEEASFFGTGTWFDMDNWTFGGPAPGEPYHGIPSSTTDITIASGAAAQVLIRDANCHDANIYGDLLVSGLSASFSYGNTLKIGNGPNVGANFTVQAGASASTTSGFTYLGYQASSIGSALISGDDTIWTNSLLFVGYEGEGSLVIQEGARTKSNSSVVGFAANSVGTATVTGSGSIWEPNGIEVGLDGIGSVIVNSGAEILSDSAVELGANMNSFGNVLVEGANSKLDCNSLSVGRYGQGTLQIWNGAKVNTYMNQNVVASAPNGTGLIDIKGPGSILCMNNINNNFIVGNSGNGTLKISDGGIAKIPSVMVTNHGGSVGTLQIEGAPGRRGVLETGSISSGGADASLILDGSILRASRDEPFNFISGFLAGGITLLPGGTFIDTQTFQISINSPIEGSGGITKAGEGTLTLNAPWSYQGGGYSYLGQTLVSEGTLLITGTVAISPISIAPGAAVGGTGSQARNEPFGLTGTTAPLIVSRASPDPTDPRRKFESRTAIT